MMVNRMQYSSSADAAIKTPGGLTHAEILQQPQLWPTTLDRVAPDCLSKMQVEGAVVVTGAGTSAYAASAVAASWDGSAAIPTTDLVLDAHPFFSGTGLLLSLARSGDSPESVAAVKKVQQQFPRVKQLAITCNANGKLASAPGVEAIVLDPRTNDRSLAMTSSFSNLVLAGLSLRYHQQLAAVLPAVCRRVESSFPEFEEIARTIARRSISRVTILASRPLFGAAREASLKILEMTAGNVVALPETFLGLRHGPMSFLRDDSLVLCILSSDPLVRRYEQDLIDELRSKQLGYIVAIVPEGPDASSLDQTIPSCAGDLPDYLRVPFEIVFPQLLAYHLSLQAGLDPDSPSPNGVITRVVQGVRIYGD
jgi:tagatose-6-phosphate ketose/aldose isomerase